MEKQRLIQKIKEANKAYRLGDPIMPDEKYDKLIEELRGIDPDHELLKKVGYKPEYGKKEELPVKLASMEKVKNIEEFRKWVESIGIDEDTPEQVIITPKYDGISLLVNEEYNEYDMKPAWTRGDGVTGVAIPQHYKKVCTTDSFFHNINGFYSVGELVMRKKTFKEKYSEDYRNPRNLVAGKANDKEPSDVLGDCDYIRYTMIPKDGARLHKKDQIDLANEINDVEVPYELTNIHRISEDMLDSLFKKWSKDYEIDGLIIELNDAKLREKIGTETGSRNPKYARAFKGGFEEIKETTVKEVQWQISKRGFLKPVVIVEPVDLEGATVTHVYGDNAKWIQECGVGEGARIKIKRSGMVIPRITEIVEEGTVRIPERCLECGSETKWNESEVELVCSEPEDCNGVKLHRIIAFFEILGIENISDQTFKKFCAEGFCSIQAILELGDHPEIMMNWEGWGEKSSRLVAQEIRKVRDKPVMIEKLQHASGYFEGLGTKKLRLVREQLGEINPSVGRLESVEGFSRKSAESYKKGIDKFIEFMSEVPIKVVKEGEQQSDKFKEWRVVFTGFRSGKIRDFIEMNGGKVTSAVSGKTTHVICKEKGSGSKKEKQAREKGIKILEKEEFEKKYMEEKQEKANLF